MVLCSIILCNGGRIEEVGTLLASLNRTKDGGFGVDWEKACISPEKEMKNLDPAYSLKT